MPTGIESCTDVYRNKMTLPTQTQQHGEEHYKVTNKITIYDLYSCVILYPVILNSRGERDRESILSRVQGWSISPKEGNLTIKE